MIYLDTYVLVKLHLGEAARLSAAARKAIERHDLLVSPAAVLELELLHEIGRIKHGAQRIVTALGVDFGLRVCDLPFRTVVEHALKEAWGRDPFDRLIVAHARAADAPLVSKDERIRQHYPRAIW